MKKMLLSVAMMMATLSLHATDANYQVVPLPQSIIAEKGAAFVLDGNTTVSVVGTDEAMLRNAAFLKEYIREATGINPTGTNKKAAAITLKLNAKVEQEEGYVITVKAKGITIEGKTPRILRYTDAPQVVALGTGTKRHLPRRTHRRLSSLRLPRNDARLRPPLLQARIH